MDGGVALTITPVIGLQYLVLLLVPWDLMINVRGLVTGFFPAMAIRTMDPGEVREMAGGLLLFIALNRVIEVYFSCWSFFCSYCRESR